MRFQKKTVVYESCRSLLTGKKKMKKMKKMDNISLVDLLRLHELKRQNEYRVFHT